MGVKEDGTIVAKDVSEDHKPDNPAEKARIQAAGGRVFAVSVTLCTYAFGSLPSLGLSAHLHALICMAFRCLFPLHMYIANHPSPPYPNAQLHFSTRPLPLRLFFNISRLSISPANLMPRSATTTAWTAPLACGWLTPTSLA